jgi:hypothetical protein
MTKIRKRLEKCRAAKGEVKCSDLLLIFCSLGFQKIEREGARVAGSNVALFNVALSNVVLSNVVLSKTYIASQ